MIKVPSDLYKLWGCYPLKTSESSNEMPIIEQQYGCQYSDIIQSLEQYIQSIKKELRSEIQQFGKQRIQDTLQFLQRSDLNLDELKQMIILKDKQYLQLYQEFKGVEVGRRIQKIRVLSLVPEQASNVQLRQMVLQLKFEIIENERINLFQQDNNEINQEFSNSILEIKETGDNIAEKLKQMINKHRQQQKNKKRAKSKALQTTFQTDQSFDTSSKISSLKKQLQQKSILVNQYQSKYKIAQQQLKVSSSLVSQLRNQLSFINLQDAHKYTLANLEVKLQKLKLGQLVKTKRIKQQSSKQKLPFSSQTIDFSSSERSIQPKHQQQSSARTQVKRLSSKLANVIFGKKKL